MVLGFFFFKKMKITDVEIHLFIQQIYIEHFLYAQGIHRSAFLPHHSGLFSQMQNFNLQIKFLNTILPHYMLGI